MNRKSLIFYSFFLILTISTIGAYEASAKDDLSIGILDRQYILKNSDAASDMRSRIEKKWSSYQEDIRKKETDLRNKGQKLSKKRASLSKDDFEKKKRLYDQEVAELQKLVKTRKGLLDKAYQTGMKDIEAHLMQIIEGIMDDKELSLILYKSQVALNKKHFDITKMAVEKLNKSLPKIKNLPLEEK